MLLLGAQSGVGSCCHCLHDSNQKFSIVLCSVSSLHQYKLFRDYFTWNPWTPGIGIENAYRFFYHCPFPSSCLSLISSLLCLLVSLVFRNPCRHVCLQTDETGTAQSACRRPDSQSRRTAAICSAVRDPAHIYTNWPKSSQTLIILRTHPFAPSSVIWAHTSCLSLCDLFTDQCRKSVL